MYNFFPYIIAVVFLLLGIYMIVNPKNATKEEFRNDEEKVAKTKRNGFFMVVLAIIMFVIGVIMPK